MATVQPPNNDLTVDTYGRWLPMGNKAAVDRLDEGFATPEDLAGSSCHPAQEATPASC